MALTQIKTSGIADDAVTGAKIADDTVAEANMANDAISIAEIKGDSAGGIHTFDANGNPMILSTGSDGQVLTATGSGTPPAFEDLPTSGATLSGSTNDTVVTVTGANAMQGESTLKFTSNYLHLNHANGGISWGTGTPGSFGTSPSIGIAEQAGYHSTGSAVDDLVIGAKHQKAVIIGTTSNASGGLTTRFSVENDGDVQVKTGNLVIGTSGKGIDFSADASNAGMDNELLDDYEEGYFTFTMDSENGDAWTSRAGYTKMRYVKIGNMVTFSGKYETNSTGGSPSGRLQITGLPFASIAATGDANNTRSFHGYIKGMSSDDNMIMHLWWMGSNSTTLLAHSFSNDNNGDMQSFTTSQLATTTVWEGDVTGTYFTS